RSGQYGYVGKDDTPSFRQTCPSLTLPTSGDLAFDCPFKGYRDAGEISAKGHDVEPLDGTRQVNWGTSFAKGFNLTYAVETLGGAKACDIRGSPEHIDQGLYVIADEGLFIPGIELAQLGNGGGVVNQHDGQNIFLVGSTHF